jgi:hypothetical protein
MRAFEINGHEGFPACSSLQKHIPRRARIKTTRQTLRQNPASYPRKRPHKVTAKTEAQERQKTKQHQLNEKIPVGLSVPLC